VRERKEDPKLAKNVCEFCGTPWEYHDDADCEGTVGFQKQPKRKKKEE
jgi:hypothetical protein